MENNNKTKKTSPKNHDKFFYDEVTKRKIERHLSDINDTISDTDIMNVITDISSANLENSSNVHVDNPPPKNSSLPDEEVKQIPTSWNIID